MGLFGTDPPKRPLAARIRPRSIDQLVGHDELLGSHGAIGQIIGSRSTVACILYGPPGTGKTTIATLIAGERRAELVIIPATSTGVSELRTLRTAAKRLASTGQEVLWFVDEIHRFGKAQLDVLLAPIEEGEISFIGATTENPSVALTPALLSRAEVIRLNSLDDRSISVIVRRGAKELDLELTEEAVAAIARTSHGDARRALNLVEKFATLQVEPSLKNIENFLSGHEILLGLDTSSHFEFTSALIKSMRASKERDALNWLARLLELGEDPRYVARRLVIFASEDIGLADPVSLDLATSAYLASERIGMPEVRIILGHVVLHLARAPKSREAYQLIELAFAEARAAPKPNVPAHLRGRITSIEGARLPKKSSTNVRDDPTDP
jgi:putative ATPase